jgi:hypothetical protein
MRKISFACLVLAIPALVALRVYWDVHVAAGTRLLADLLTFGSAIAAMWALRGVTLRPRVRLAVASLLVAALSIHWFWIRPHSAVWSFELHRSTFERRLAETLADPALDYSSFTVVLRDGSAVVEPGPQKRVAFPTGLGLLDSWVAIVYDPSGMCMLANRNPPGSENAGPELAAGRLFGGWLFRAEELAPGWYRCYFT